MSEYIVLENNIIVEHRCGPLPKGEDCREVPDNWPGFIGEDVRSFSPNWRPRPLQDRILDDLVRISSRDVIEGETVRPKTFLECIRDGLEKAPKGQKLVKGKDGALALEDMTVLEQVEVGQITKDTGAAILESVERANRGALLKESDWTQLEDAGVLPNAKDAWKEYRQALRDVTAQPGWPWDVKWPISPDGIQI